MTRFSRKTSRLAFFALSLCAAIALPAHADSLASSASDSASRSVGSLSDSIRKSSDGPPGNERRADGDYKIIEVADTAQQPDAVRLKLHPVADAQGTDGEFFLYLPRTAFDAGRMTTGHVVTAYQRPYGVEFADGEPRRAFFLALQDDWYRELQSHALAL